MQKWLPLIIIIIVAVLVQPASAETSSEPQTPPTLCLPGVYLEGSPASCWVMGPAAYFTERAYIQSEIAAQPYRFPHISSEYGLYPNNYFRAKDKSPVFATMQDALNNSNAIDSLYEGFTFASYISTISERGITVYQLPDGTWMRSTSVSYHSAPNRFLGVMPTEQPSRLFGWLVTETKPLKEPDYQAQKTGTVLPKYTFVEAFAVERAGLSDWYMIAPDEWVHMTQVAMVYPAEQPPEGLKVDKWIEINLFEQTISAYENGQLVFATLITTGSSRFYTRPGIFKIYEKLNTTDMAGDLGEESAYYLMDVPWTMYFDDRRALHAQYWHDHLGYKSSHGCVNLSFPDAQWFFEWAQIGDWVYVWDPSGQTPVDPKLFTQDLEEDG